MAWQWLSVVTSASKFSPCVLSPGCAMAFFPCWVLGVPLPHFLGPSALLHLCQQSFHLTLLHQCFGCAPRDSGQEPDGPSATALGRCRTQGRAGREHSGSVVRTRPSGAWSHLSPRVGSHGTVDSGPCSLQLWYASRNDGDDDMYVMGFLRAPRT